MQGGEVKDVSGGVVWDIFRLGDDSCLCYSVNVDIVPPSGRLDISSLHHQLPENFHHVWHFIISP